MGIWSTEAAEGLLNQFVTQQQVDIERFEEGVAKDEAALAKIIEKSPDDSRIEQRQERIDKFKEDISDAKEAFAKLEEWHTPVSWILTLSPKTGQTIGLLDRWLSDPEGYDIAAIMRGEMQSIEEMREIDPTTRGARERETMKRMQEDYSSRSLWYVVGTSLLFEGFVLGIASLYFCRKDF